MGRLTKADEQRIIEGYEAWNQDEMSVGELAESLGTNRQTLYKVLERNGVPTRREAESSGSFGTTPLEKEMAAIAFKSMTDDLVLSRMWAHDACEAMLKHLSKAGSADEDFRRLLMRRP